MLNRRNFVTGLLCSPIGVALSATVLTHQVAEKLPKAAVLPQPPIDQVFAAKRALDAKVPPAGIWGDAWKDSIREKHQKEMNIWLREKVDEQAFKMMTGRV